VREVNRPPITSPTAASGNGPDTLDSGIIVLKFGGSVLRDEADLARGVGEIARWLARGRRVVAVVSAFEGTTDALLARARAVDPAHTPESHPDALALLLATGEFTTASLLTLALARAGVTAALLGPHQLALRTRGRGADADPASIDTPALERALAESSVVVVPGFVGVGVASQFTLLGRGGSDLTALYIAAELGARCRLIKDVDGLYERDPALPGPPPKRYLTLSWADALALDGGIVQHKAVRLAQERELSFEVGSFDREDVSTVGPYRATWQEASGAACGVAAACAAGVSGGAS
jgi:homoserine dehydrogenase